MPLPATNSNLICVDYDNAVVNGATCEAQILTDAGALAEIAVIKSIPGASKRVIDKSTGALIQSVFDIIPLRPTYTKAQARLAFASLIGGKAGADLCEGACPEQFMVQDLDATAGLAWTGSNTLNMDTLPAPGFNGLTFPPGPDAGEAFGADFRILSGLGSFGLSVLHYDTTGATAASQINAPNGYSDGITLPGPVPAVFELTFGQNEGPPAVSDGLSLPGQRCGGMDASDKLILTLAGGQTKEFTVNTPLEWWVTTSSTNVVEVSPTFKFYLSDEGDMFLSFVQVDVPPNVHTNSIQEYKIGSTVIRRTVVESGVLVEDFNITGGQNLTFPESCALGVKL
jgi:hypothetical protein